MSLRTVNKKKRGKIMGFFDKFDKLLSDAEKFLDKTFPEQKRVYDRYELIEYFKEEITGHTSGLHEKRTTNIYEIVMERLKNFDSKIDSFKLYTCNPKFEDCGNGIYRIEFACILDSKDIYGGACRSYNLDVRLFANKYAELVNKEDSSVRVTKR